MPYSWWKHLQVCPGSAPGQNINMMPGQAFSGRDRCCEQLDQHAVAVLTRNLLHLPSGLDKCRSVNISLGTLAEETSAGEHLGKSHHNARCGSRLVEHAYPRLFRRPVATGSFVNRFVEGGVVKLFDLDQRQTVPRCQSSEARHGSSKPWRSRKILSKVRHGDTGAKSVETTASGNQRGRADLRHLHWVVAPGEGDCAD